MRSIETTNNSKTWQFFENLRNFENLLIFKFDNSKILLKFGEFRKLSNFHYWNFFSNVQIYKIYQLKKTVKIWKIWNLENYKKFERKIEKIIKIWVFK